MAHICAVVLNSVSRDTRVLKEAAALVDAGHAVTIVGLRDKNNTLPDERLENGTRILRADTAANTRLAKQLLISLCYLGATVAVIVAFNLTPAEQVDLLYLGIVVVLALGLLRQFQKISATLSCEGANGPEQSRGGGPVLGIGRAAAYTVRHLLPDPAWLAVLVRAVTLFAKVARTKPDAVHCHDVHTLPVGAMAKWFLRCPVVYDAHEIYEEIAQGTQTTARRYRRMHRLFLPMVDRFITINDSIADWYAGKYPSLPPAVVIMNATQKAPPFSYDGRLHRAAGLPDGARILLYQGGYATKRGLDYLICAAEHLPPDWTLVMMGWGALEPHLRSVAAGIEMRIGNRPSPVRFVPPAPQAELPMWTAGATIGVIPYENIGLNHWFCTPNKLWEYPNAGVPVLVSPFPELRKPVEKYGFGWLLPEDQDPHGMASLVASLSDSEIARARAACADFIEAENWSKYGARVAGLYDELLADCSLAPSPAA